MKPKMTYPGHIRAVLTLGLPLIGGYLGEIAIQTTDTVMTGWYGIEALAAVALGTTYLFVLFIFGSGFALAVMPLVAAFAAKDDEQGIRRATRMGLWLSVGFATLALPLLLGSRPILLAMGQTEQVATDAAAYLRIAGWGLLPALLVMTLKSYLSALERTQIVLWIILFAAVMNGLANYALIFGNWGAPELGVRGAAIASVMSHTVSLLGVVIYILWALPQHALFVRLWRGDRTMLAQVFDLGWPISLTSLSEVGLFAGATVMMGWLGTVPLAAEGIVVQVASVAFILHLGLSNVATIRAGNAFGRGDTPHMARGARVVTAMSLVIGGLTAAVFIVWPDVLIRLFIRPGEEAAAEILAIGTALLFMAALFQTVDSVQVIAMGLLRGVQDTRMPMILAGVSYWIVGLPCSYILGFPLGYGGVGIWAGLVIALSVAAVLMSARFWLITIRRLPDEPEAVAG